MLNRNVRHPAQAQVLARSEARCRVTGKQPPS